MIPQQEQALAYRSTAPVVKHGSLAEAGVGPIIVVTLYDNGSMVWRAFTLRLVPACVSVEVGHTNPGSDEALLEMPGVALLVRVVEQGISSVVVVWARMVMVVLSKLHKSRASKRRRNIDLQ